MWNWVDLECMHFHVSEHKINRKRIHHIHVHSDNDRRQSQMEYNKREIKDMFQYSTATRAICSDHWVFVKRSPCQPFIMHGVHLAYHAIMWTYLTSLMYIEQWKYFHLNYIPKATSEFNFLVVYTIYFSLVFYFIQNVLSHSKVLVPIHIYCFSRHGSNYEP